MRQTFLASLFLQVTVPLFKITKSLVIFSIIFQSPRKPSFWWVPLFPPAALLMRLLQKKFSFNSFLTINYLSLWKHSLKDFWCPLPNNSTSWNIPQTPKNKTRKIYLYPSVSCSTNHSTQNLQTIQVHKNRWLDKETMVDIHNGILLCCMKS